MYTSLSHLSEPSSVYYILTSGLFVISGVAVGSSIGHAIGGFFGGGSTNAAVENQPTENAVASQSADGGYQTNSWGARSCETDAKSFTKCLDENGGNMQICGWYLDQLVIMFLFMMRGSCEADSDSNTFNRKLAKQPPVSTDMCNNIWEPKSTPIDAL